METEIKWAEVAHYYAAAGIEISLIPYTIDQFMTGVVRGKQNIYTSLCLFIKAGLRPEQVQATQRQIQASILPILKPTGRQNRGGG